MWLTRARRQEAWIEGRRRELRTAIEHLATDADTLRDRQPGTTLTETDERLGANPSIAKLEHEFALLLSWVSLGCPAEEVRT